MNEYIKYRNFQLFKWLGWILLFFLIWFKGCKNSDLEKKETIVVPDITKTLPTAKAKEIIHVPVSVPKWYKDNRSELALNEELKQLGFRLKRYQEEIDWMQDEFKNSDSIKQAELYRLATELKKFESNFEDENLKLTVNGIIAGNEVKEITPTYTIKERKIDVPQKQIKFRLLGGVGLANTLKFDKALFNANLGFQNAKGNILRIGYDSESRIFIGYDISIFKISK